MKKNISLLLVIVLCFCLTACGASATSKAPAESAAPATLAAETVSPAMEAMTATPEPTPEPMDIQSLVDTLNEAELSQRSEEDPSIGVFVRGNDNNTIVYKIAMHIFQYVIMQAEGGNAENLAAYNNVLDSLPAVEVSMEEALREANPDLNIQVMLMYDEYSGDVAAVIDNGAIVYDLVNSVGTAPEGVTPIIAVELDPEIQAQVDELLSSVGSEG